MSSFVFLNAMIDASKSLIAKKLRSSFSYLARNLRNRLNQLRAATTTQRLVA